MQCNAKDVVGPKALRRHSRRQGDLAPSHAELSESGDECTGLFWWRVKAASVEFRAEVMFYCNYSLIEDTLLWQTAMANQPESSGGSSEDFHRKLDEISQLVALHGYQLEEIHQILRT
ncbi:hypothetical protein Sjap_008043 [Stephania japonica]|uniref:Uncharacterized protein n=1 Tax=Stephania japonica TaxID=461633 RepID=A0AAP0JPE3_9MAGN